jgi:hypothetical protein
MFILARFCRHTRAVRNTSQMTTPPIENKILLNGSVEAAVKDDQLSVVGADMTRVPG